MNEIMNEILNFSDFLSPTKNLIPHVCGLQSSPLRSCLLAAAPRGNNMKEAWTLEESLEVILKINLNLWGISQIISN